MTRYSSIAALLFASALPADQARLAALGVPLSAQVLKLVGTGARWGLDPGFFQQANPSVVILPSGVASQFARPTRGTYVPVRLELEARGSDLCLHDHTRLRS